jgi:hypothetical protein
VLFGKWSGTEVKLDGEELLIMKESDIMGVLDLLAAVRSCRLEGHPSASRILRAGSSPLLTGRGTPIHFQPE